MLLILVLPGGFVIAPAIYFVRRWQERRGKHVELAAHAVAAPLSTRCPAS